MLIKKFLMFLMILGVSLTSEDNNLVAQGDELKKCKQSLEEANKMLEDANNNIEVASRAATEYKNLLEQYGLLDKGFGKKRSDSEEYREPDPMVQVMQAPLNIVEDKKGNKYNLIDNPKEQSGWNCFDVSVHLEKILGIPEVELSSLGAQERARRIRERMVEVVLKEGNANTKKGLKIRALLAREIIAVHFVHHFVENPSPNDRFQTPKQTMNLVRALAKTKIDSSTKDLFPKDNQEFKYGKYEMFYESLCEAASEKKVFESYMDHYYKKNNFAIAPSGDTTSIIDVLAEIYPQYQFVIFAPLTELQSGERVIVPGKIVHSKTVNPSGKEVRYIWFDTDGRHFKELQILKDQVQIQRNVSQGQNQRSKSQNQIKRSAEKKNAQKETKRPLWKL